MVHLLLIEDDATIRAALIRAFGEQGHAVSSASTGGQGLQIAVQERPDLVVLDLGLPDLDGRESQAFDSAGGSVVARCNGRDAQVVTWTAAQGFRVQAENQQGHDVEIEFESDERDVKVKITCVDGVPTAEVDEDEDD